ncbi:DUF6474 family protein [Pseudonocardia sp. GCM10023141]|uniref:DUF6474 family protein n=1 Tax=Pseudonocardia sp. GCM10023141 TaxID=3252653 RepID=UPI00360A87CF
MGLRKRSGSKSGTADGGGAALASVAATGATKGRKPLTASSAKRMIGVGRTVLPLLAPYALVAAGAVRARWDSYQADRLGVATDQLSSFRGPGGVLHARLSRIAEALEQLDPVAEAHSTGAARKFALDTRPRIAELSIAVRAAEQMPGQRRRAAYRAIGRELDRIESALLTHLGVTT